jgi:hypothetical protein
MSIFTAVRWNLTACLVTALFAGSVSAQFRAEEYGLYRGDYLPDEARSNLQKFAAERNRIAAEAERSVAAARGELISRLEELKRKYAGQPYAAEGIATEIRRLQIEAGEPGDDAVRVLSFRDPANIGKSFTFRVTGTTAGSVWGCDIYTDDSALGAAAVHAGMLADGETGLVRVTVLPGRESYQGVSRNGVVSASYGSWHGSYLVDRAPEPTRVAAVVFAIDHPAAPASMSGVAGEIGQSFDYSVTGSTEGSVWGNEIYTDDSSIAAAAVHAGLLKSGEKGAICVTLLPGRYSYSAATRNGVGSTSYGGWSRSYMLDRPEIDAPTDGRIRFYYEPRE